MSKALLLLTVLVAVSANLIDSWTLSAGASEMGEGSDGVHTMSDTHSSGNYGADNGNDNTYGLAAHGAGFSKNPWIQTDMLSRKQVGKVDVLNIDSVYGNRIYINGGALVGLSDTPCSNDDPDAPCDLTTVCGEIESHTTALDTEFGAGLKYTVDCKGAIGRYVYLLLPGDSRLINIKEIDIFDHCSVSCCKGTWTNSLSSNPQCTQTGDILSALHDTGSGHSQHRCYQDPQHANGCTCECSNLACPSGIIVDGGPGAACGNPDASALIERIPAIPQGADRVTYAMCSNACLANADCVQFQWHFSDQCFLYNTLRPQGSLATAANWKCGTKVDVSMTGPSCDICPSGYTAEPTITNPQDWDMAKKGCTAGSVWG